MIKAKLHEQEGLSLDAWVNCEAEPCHTAGTHVSRLPGPQQAQIPASQVDQVPCQSTDTTKEKVQHAEGVASAVRDTSPSVKLGIAQYGSQVTAHIVLRQAEQEDIFTI